MLTGNLLQLLHLCDPALPIGGFSHSAGLETYVQAGIVCNRQTVSAFTANQLAQNIFYTDAALMSLAFDAATTCDMQTIIQLDDTCTAVKLPREIRQASQKLGIRLLRNFAGSDNIGMVEQYRQHIKQQDAQGHYCIAFGLLAAAMHIGKQAALTGFYYNAATSFVTNAVKLVPLGQHEGQQLLMELFPLINDLAARSLTPDFDLVGYCCPGFDIRCMQHEQLYSRLYMS